MNTQDSRFTKFIKTTFGMVAVAIFCNFLWGSAFPSGKTAYLLYGIADAPPACQILLGGLRFTLAGLMVLVFKSITEKKAAIPGKIDAFKAFKLCIFQTVLQYTFYNIGLNNTSGVKASIFEGFSVFVAILVSALIFKMEKLNAKIIIGCLVGFFGVFLVNFELSTFDISMTMLGEGFIMISTVAYAFSTVLMKHYSQNSDPVMLAGTQFVFGGIIMTILGITMGGYLRPSDAVPCILILIYLSFISAAAYSLWGSLLKIHPVSKITVYSFTNPMFGVVLSAIILGETQQALKWQTFVALPLVCFGIWFVNRAQGEKQ